MGNSESLPNRIHYRLSYTLPWWQMGGSWPIDITCWRLSIPPRHDDDTQDRHRNWKFFLWIVPFLNTWNYPSQRSMNVNSKLWIWKCFNQRRGTNSSVGCYASSFAQKGTYITRLLHNLAKLKVAAYASAGSYKLCSFVKSRFSLGL